MKPKILFAAVLLAGASLASAQDHSLFNESIVGVVNTSISGYIGALDSAYSGDGTPTSASATASFRGMRRDGNDGGVMVGSGTCATSTEYGALHVTTTASLTNSFYNPDNPIYYDSRDNSFHPEGTPDVFASLGFAGFTDTLQFGGDLPDQYEARYVFHIDGTNDGVGSAADLAVNIGNDHDAFFDFHPGHIDTTFGTKGFTVDGTRSQTVNVQFSDQVTLNTYDHDDGTDYSGSSDFGATARLLGIALYDTTTGRFVPSSQWSVTSASGTGYARLNSAPVPEPCSVLVMGGGAYALLRRRRRVRMADLS